MKIRFLGANRQVTGSRYLVEAAGLRVMVDCGLFQERPFLDRNWAPPMVEPRSIDALMLTHAHLDHCGLIPRLIQQGFDSPIYATAPTVELAELVMLDSARIQEEDAAYKVKRHERDNHTPARPVRALYTQQEARRAAAMLRAVNYHEPVKLSKDVQVVYREAGHILGAACLEFQASENGRTTTALFSGDLGQWGKPIIRDPELLYGADAVIMESTYGDKNHDHTVGIEEQLNKILVDAIAAGGNVVIPTFATERAQELMYYIGRLTQSGKVRPVPVFMDSPMAADVSDVFRKYRSLFNDEAQRMLQDGASIFRFPGLKYTRTSDESKAINDFKGPCVIMATAGMCTGGRIKHHLRHNIERPESTIVFVGYQSEGTLGREIMEGRSPVRIHGQFYDVKAKVVQISGMSAHAGHDDLLRWARHFGQRPGTLFLTHGEAAVSEKLAAEIRLQMAWNVKVPDFGEQVDLT